MSRSIRKPKYARELSSRAWEGHECGPKRRRKRRAMPISGEHGRVLSPPGTVVLRPGGSEVPSSPQADIDNNNKEQQ